MDQHNRLTRMLAAAIACAVVCHLLAAGPPNNFLTLLSQPNTLAFLTYLETGRNVRFSSSSALSLEFAPESCAPFFPFLPEEAALPAFSGEEAVEIWNASGLEPDITALLTAPLAWDLTGNDPAVLILHTHTTESYTQAGENYVETSAWRTLDEGYNMLSIGDRVAEILSQYGITALQDRQLHDYPSYNGSYAHARKALRQYLEAYPSICLILDLHRDASETANGQLRTLATVGNAQSAQLMLVLGTNAAGLKHDRWEENLALALKLQVQLERQTPGITRPLYLRSQRFNQDVSPGALLVEVGAAGNTHAEALLAAEQLAHAIGALGKGTQNK
jgi:stage II sporulation protein P